MMPNSELTLAAIELWDWDVVLLRSRSKQAAGDHWNITGDSWRGERHLDAGGNLALLCGPSSGVAVPDFDDTQAAREMADAVAPLQATVLTGSGGLHCYVRHEEGLPAHITWQGRRVGDVQRGPRQLVVLPPSIHPDTGEPYRWIANPLEELPRLPAAWRQHFRYQQPKPASVPFWTPPRGRGNLPPAAEIQARAQALPRAKQRARGAVKFQCPACAAEGHDRAHDNARVGPDGRWGCAYAPGDREHRRAIGRALGVVA